MANLGIVQDFDERYEEAYSAWNNFYPEAEIDLRYFLGDQWTTQDKRDLFQQGRNAFVFNRVRRTINMITGYQRKHRLSSVVTPIENSDQKTADQLSQLLLYSMNACDGYRTISDCFGGAAKTGWNLCSLWMDYRDDPVNGDIKLGREPYNGFILDPYLTQLDLSDCQYLIRRKYLSVGQVKSLLPGNDKELDQLNKIGWSRDDKFTWLPYQRQPNGETLMAYNEMYEQKWRSVPMLVDMETGEFMEFDVEPGRVQFMIEQFPQLKVVKRPKKFIEMHVIVNDEPMKKEINPYGLDEYPFVPFTAIFEPESDQWGLKVQSLTRCMRDPQDESNRRRSQMIDVLDSQINSGWIANENSVVNPASLFQSSQGKVIWRREDAPPGALEKIPAAQIPPSMFQLQELFDRDIMEIAGVNDAAFGVSDNAQESGIMMQLRQGAAMINLQDVFDNLRFSQKALSKKVLKLLQTWTPQKVKRILNEDPTQEFYNKDFTKYDVTVQEGILTDTQRQMNFRQMIDLYQLTGGPQGSPITPDMLYEAAPLQGKSDTNEKVKQNQAAQQQAAQKQEAIQQQLLDSQRQSQQAKAISDLALSSERKARTHSNLALSTERISESEQNRAQAALDRAKTITEISTMQDSRLYKLIEIVRMLETEEIIDREGIAQKVNREADQLEGSIRQDFQQAGASTAAQEPQQPGSSLEGLL